MKRQTSFLAALLRCPTNTIRAMLGMLICGGVLVGVALRPLDAVAQNFARQQNFLIAGSGWGDAGLFNLGHGGWDASTSGYGNFTLAYPLQFNAGNGGNFYGLVINDRTVGRFVQVVWLWDDDLTVVPPPAGMALIPAGSFMMGDTLDGDSDAAPVSTTVSAFYMDVNLVSYSQWQSVYSWATSHGYFVHAGEGKAANHPVQTVDWYDAVKWCNARSEQAGLTPVYYTDAGLTAVYRTGEVTVYANWTAKGYRLPTEAEWEKAARGGLSGQRFPWGNNITENLANYYGNTDGHSYDSGPNGYNAAFSTGSQPYTSPVGYFAPNAYGLYDMAGNVSAWCWDWYGTTYAGGTDPRGAASGGYRMLRGGSWDLDAYYSRCAFRLYGYPDYESNGIGFRCARGL